MRGPIDPETLLLVMGGHTASRLLWSGTQLGVFEFLSEKPGATEAELQKHTKLKARPFRILLTGMLSLGLVVRVGEGLRNADAVEAMLVRKSPGNWVDALGWQHEIVYQGQVDLLESLRENRNVGLRRFEGTEDTLYARLTHDPVKEKVFQDSMSSLSKSANRMLVQRVDLSRCTHLVDCGGGDGTNAIELARANPHLTVTVFDSPSVCRIAEANIAKAGLADRVRTHPGDLFTTPFPKGVDCVLFAHMMTIWSPEKDTVVLKRAYDALPEGGQVIIFNMMGKDDLSGPLTTALGSPYFLSIATGEGMLYTWKEYEGFLAAAGFAQTQRCELPKDHGALVGRK